jgi:osmotically-inducible protein OsmY
MSEQQVITTQIRSRYEDDSRLPHPTEIAIDARAQTVTLRGTVGSPKERKAAVEIAESVPGVRRVVEDLHVDLRDDYIDQEIRGAALQALIDAPDVRADLVDAKVSGAWVTLTGEVRHQDESTAAFDAVSRLSGIGGITNKIAVVAPAGQ